MNGDFAKSVHWAEPMTESIAIQGRSLSAIPYSVSSPSRLFQSSAAAAAAAAADATTTSMSAVASPAKPASTLCNTWQFTTASNMSDKSTAAASASASASASAGAAHMKQSGAHEFFDMSVFDGAFRKACESKSVDSKAAAHNRAIREEESIRSDTSMMPDMAMMRVQIYDIYPLYKEATTEGVFAARKFWPSKVDFRINYPVNLSIALGYLGKNRANGPFERHRTQECVMFQAVNITASGDPRAEGNHWIAIIVDSRRKLGKSRNKKYMYYWDPFGHGVTSAPLAQAIRDFTTSHGGFEFRVIQDQCQNDYYQCGVWVIYCFEEYFAHVVTANPENEFTVVRYWLAGSKEMKIFDLGLSYANASATHASRSNTVAVAEMRSKYKQLIDNIDKELEKYVTSPFPTLTY